MSRSNEPPQPLDYQPPPAPRTAARGGDNARARMVASAAGTKVWMTAFWFNGRKQSGPACAPVSANLPGGLVAMAGVDRG